MAVGNGDEGVYPRLAPAATFRITKKRAQSGCLSLYRARGVVPLAISFKKKGVDLGQGEPIERVSTTTHLIEKSFHTMTATFDRLLAESALFSHVVDERCQFGSNRWRERDLQPFQEGKPLDRAAAKAGFGTWPCWRFSVNLGLAPRPPSRGRLDLWETDFALVRQMQISDYNKLIDGYLAKGP
jgi:hypothetical protein